MTDNVKERAEELEFLKWKLTELANQEPDDIESNEIEILGEDANGADAYFTANITDIANEAHEAITELLTELEIATSSLAMHKTIRKEAQAQVEALKAELIKADEIAAWRGSEYIGVCLQKDRLHKQVEALRVREVKLVSGLEYYANDSAWSDMGDYDGWCFDGLGSSAAQQALATTSPEESE